MLTTRDLVDAHLYPDEDAVIQDALRHLLRARPTLRIDLALYRYQHEDISLAKAAEIAGVSWAHMRDLLLERGVEPKLGPETLDEAQQEVDAIRTSLTTRP